MSNIKCQISKMLVPMLVLVMGLTLVPSVFAHVTVKPNQVGVAAYQTFTVSVPNEKDNPTVALRLVIPEGLTSVTPNVKPGWVVNSVKSGEGEDAKVTEITWTGGSIPAGMRDEFYFSAKTPSNEGQLQWKAYQAYQNGVTVNWDMDPNAPKPSVAPGHTDEGGSTPFSVTKVVNDLAAATAAPAEAMTAGNQISVDKTPLYFSIAALGLSAAAIGLALRKR